MSQNNAIFIAVFGKDSIFEMTKILIESMNKNIKDSSIDLLILTSIEWEEKIKKILDTTNLSTNIVCLKNVNHLDTNYLVWKRFELFKHFDVSIYEKILYLDADIIIDDNINEIFNIDMDKPIYSYSDIRIGHEQTYINDTGPPGSSKDCSGFSWIKRNNKINFFKDKGRFSTGVMLLYVGRYEKELKKYFSELFTFFKKNISGKGYPDFYEFDQPSAIIFFTMLDIVKPDGLNNFVINNDDPLESGKKLPIRHFPGGVGNDNKVITMGKYQNGEEY